MNQSKIPVRAFMKKDVKTIMPLNTIEDAAKIFYEKNVNSLLVIEDDKLIGIITEKDLVAGMLVFGHKKDEKVRKIMSTPVVSVSPDISVIKAANIMIEKRIHKLPVLEKGKLVGLISASDLIVIFSMNKESNLVKILGAQIGS